MVDLYLEKDFDNIPKDLLLRAVKKHATEPWMVLYIERWLNAPVEEENGQLVPREKGTPQGGVISPLLANLFLHHAFDRWMAKTYKHHCSHAGMRAGASSGEDEGCLLQG